LLLTEIYVTSPFAVFIRKYLPNSIESAVFDFRPSLIPTQVDDVFAIETATVSVGLLPRHTSVERNSFNWPGRALGSHGFGLFHSEGNQSLSKSCSPAAVITIRAKPRNVPLSVSNW
jgi:hypothetical protein